jgi:hypothetical protein
MVKTENGYFLIADITGYTQYLSASELEHAHGVMQTLLTLLIQHTRPPLIISRLAGDAVISYGLQDNFIQGQTFLEMIEDTYVAFRKAINLMVLNNSCHCNACANIGNLDLKFFVHYGTFIRQRLDQHDELLGTDVIVIHRLLKNHVTEETGYRAYALFTEAAVRQLGIEDISAIMTAHTEAYENLGEIKTWVQDMLPVWKIKQEQAQITIAPEQTIYQQEAEFPVPVEIIWDFLSKPKYRSLLMNAIRQNILNQKNGRIAPGSSFQCFHGDGRVTEQTILEWHPFQQMTTEEHSPVPNTTILINYRLDPTEKGTRYVMTFSKARGPWLNRLICDLTVRVFFANYFKKGLEKFQSAITQELAKGGIPATKPTTFAPETIEQAIQESLPGA